MCCGVSRRQASYLTLLWLWCRLAAAALIQPLAWELSYAIGEALKRKRKKKKKKDAPSVFVYVSSKALEVSRCH